MSPSYKSDSSTDTVRSATDQNIHMGWMQTALQLVEQQSSYVIRHFQQTVRSLKTSRPRWTQLTAVVGRVYVGSCLPRRRRRRRLRRWEASGQEADSQVPGRLAHCSGPAGKTFPPAWTLSLGFGHTSELAPVDEIVAKIPPLEICLC